MRRTRQWATYGFLAAIIAALFFYYSPRIRC